MDITFSSEILEEKIIRCFVAAIYHVACSTSNQLYKNVHQITHVYLYNTHQIVPIKVMMG